MRALSYDVATSRGILPDIDVGNFYALLLGGDVRARLAAISALVVALLVVQAAPAVAAEPPSLEAGTVRVQLAAPAGYTTPAGMPTLDLSGISGWLAGNEVDESDMHVESDASGILSFEDIAPGTYDLWVDDPEHSDLFGGYWAAGKIAPDTVRTDIVVTASGGRPGG
jgi:hypothetical protein